MYKQLKNILSKLLPRYDRLKHFFLGFFIFYVAKLFTTELLSLFLVAIIATIIELMDSLEEDNKFDKVDLLFTVLPGMIIFIFN